MQIHVVAPGQTFAGIAQTYGISLEALLRTNDVPNPDHPVVGQTVVIPIDGRYHWVQRGETYATISRRYGVPVQRLIEVNHIAPNRLHPGLRLYIPPGTRRWAESNGYLEPRGQAEERAEVAAVARDLTYLSLFSYKVNRAGTVDPLNDAAAREGARAGGAAPMMAITNIDRDQFSRAVGEAILSSEQIQDRLLSNVLQTMRERGFRALNIDFEHLRPEDREPYNNFLRRAARRVHEAGFLISTALAPKISREQRGAWYEAHDYRAHGQIVDFVVLMTYEWGWSGGAPFAVAPANLVDQVLRYALTEIPPQKIMMGVPLYGYDWTLPYVQGGPFAKVVSPQAAIRLAAQHDVRIQYDTKSQAPFFHYHDDQGKEHVVWFEDARSIQAKFDLVKRHGLRGVSYWKLPLEFPQNWLLLRDNFQIAKR